MNKKIFIALCLAGLGILGYIFYPGGSCCGKSVTSNACLSSAESKGLTGCIPSNCRGPKTKNGEAKVIADLRNDLIDLKAELEKRKDLEFPARTYDIDGIVGKTDEESIEIISHEVQIIEEIFAEKNLGDPVQSIYPENKAQQVQLLQQKITNLRTAMQ